MLQYRAVGYEYFVNQMEFWEAIVLSGELGYCDRNLLESQRTIAYILAQSNSKKKLKPTDIAKYAWEEKTKITKHTLLSKEEIEDRQKQFKEKIDGSRLC